jgi:archaeal flagellin FlaB
MFNRLCKQIKSIGTEEKGMTGLETAIILIAFVTVAAVFSYAVLSAGLYSAERGKETIYAGLAEAKSNLEMSGSLLVKADNTKSYVKEIFFTLKNAIAGSPVDLSPNSGSTLGQNKCVISLTTDTDYLSNIKWSRNVIGNDNGNNLLEPGEQFEIHIDLNDLGDNNTLTDNLTINKAFSLQVKPAIGSTVTIQRTLPPALDTIVDLH